MEGLPCGWNGRNAWFLRHPRTAFLLTLVAALCFAGMLAVFAFDNQPGNLQVVSDSAGSLAYASRCLGRFPCAEFCPGTARVHSLTSCCPA